MEYIVKGGRELRLGYTTGSCAAAAAKGAAQLLLSGRAASKVEIPLPSGQRLSIPVYSVEKIKQAAICTVIKDGGDDPDVTNGMEICAKVSFCSNGVLIKGGKGIGKVTKSGLSCKVGQWAINRVPMEMIKRALEELNCAKGFTVTIFAPKGEEVARKTFNSRLGIKGGISILGTTGIVEPMSETALIETIKIEIASKNTGDILLLAPGNYGMDFIKEELNLNIDNAVKISNFIGEALDFSVYKGFKRILLVGHVGKLCKLSAGIMNTHSKIADGRNEIFAALAGVSGIKQENIKKIMDATTTDEIHSVIVKSKAEKELYKALESRILRNISYRVGGKINTEIIVFSKENGILIESENAKAYIDEIKNKDVLK